DGRLRQVPHLVGGVGAGPDLQLGAGAPVAGIVEALARLGVVQLSVGLRFEDLRARVIAGVEVYRRAVGGAASVDVQALAECLQGAAGLNDGPLLSAGAVAGVDLNRGEVRGVRSPDVDAQP